MKVNFLNSPITDIQDVMVMNTVATCTERVRRKENLFVCQNELSFDPFFSILTLRMKCFGVLKEGKLKNMQLMLGEIDIFGADDEEVGIPKVDIFFWDHRYL